METNKKAIDFIKMHGCGNDFMIIDNREHKLELTKEQIISLANYKKSVGFDQLFLITESSHADIGVRIFNNDGMEVAACGNGSRAVADFILNHIKQNSLTIATLNRVITAYKQKNNMIAINMGIANISQEKFEFPEIRINGILVDVGNPHIVILLNDCEENYLEYGPIIENDSRFPNKINVNFAQVIDRTKIKLRTWERGAGATLACGTGACATFALLNRLNLINDEAIISQKGGDLYLSKKENEIFMAGTTQISYQGKVEINV